MCESTKTCRGPKLPTGGADILPLGADILVHDFRRAHLAMLRDSGPLTELSYPGGADFSTPSLGLLLIRRQSGNIGHFFENWPK